MTILDTSAVLRFLLRDDREKAEQVALVLENESSIFIPQAVFIELDFVLRKSYRISRSDVAYQLSSLSDLPNVKTDPETRVALTIYLGTNLSLADCFVLAYAHGQSLCSFDVDLMKNRY